MIPDTVLKENGYRKTVATKIKGFPNELVIVDSNEYDALKDDLRKELFTDVDDI